MARSHFTISQGMIPALAASSTGSFLPPPDLPSRFGSIEVQQAVLYPHEQLNIDRDSGICAVAWYSFPDRVALG
jgi:hypothetical protein